MNNTYTNQVWVFGLVLNTLAWLASLKESLLHYDNA